MTNSVSNTVANLRRFALAVAVLGGGFPACGSDDSRLASAVAADASTSKNVQDGGDAEPDAPAEAGPGTFTHVYEHAFMSCKLKMCHGGGLIGIDMSSRDGAYASLVDQPSNPTAPCAKLGKKRIQPGQPDESLLYLKLDANAPCGQQMPPGGQLTQELRDEVRQWIESGASDD
jgi:hypothetical protein